MRRGQCLWSRAGWLQVCFFQGCNIDPQHSVLGKASPAGLTLARPLQGLKWSEAELTAAVRKLETAVPPCTHLSQFTSSLYSVSQPVTSGAIPLSFRTPRQADPSLKQNSSRPKSEAWNHWKWFVGTGCSTWGSGARGSVWTGPVPSGKISLSKGASLSPVAPS